MITSIKFSDDQLHRTGIRTRVIDGLGSLVVLAGPNGGGKSRVLGMVHERAQRYMTVAQALQQVMEIPDLSPTERELEARRRKEFETEAAWLAARDWQNFSVSSLPYASSIGIQELANLSPSAADSIYRDAASQGLITARSAMQVYVYRAIETIWSSKHPDLASVVSDAGAKATAFCDLVDDLLKGKLDYALDPNTLKPLPLFRGRLFEPNWLSPGERVLMDWAIMLHSQEASRPCRSSGPHRRAGAAPTSRNMLENNLEIARGTRAERTALGSHSFAAVGRTG